MEHLRFEEFFGLIVLSELIMSKVCNGRFVVDNLCDPANKKVGCLVCSSYVSIAVILWHDLKEGLGAAPKCP